MFFAAIVRPFADPGVGSVSSEDRVDSEGGEGAYVRFEMALRRLENRASTLVGLTILMISGLWLVTFLYTGSLKGLSHGKAMIVNACGSSIGNLLPGGGAAGVVVPMDEAAAGGLAGLARADLVVLVSEDGSAVASPADDPRVPQVLARVESSAEPGIGELSLDGRRFLYATAPMKGATVVFGRDLDRELG